MHRRKYLIGLVTAATIAGCGDVDEDDDEADDVDDTEEDVDDNGTDESDDTEETDDSEEETDDAGEEEEESDDDEEEEGEGAVVEAGESHSFDGSGAEVTDEFSLEPGILTVDFSHTGERNFIVNMVALEGEQWDDELLVNVIGDTEGSSVMSINGGQYQIDVDADGDWSLDLDQPEVTADDQQELPVEESGSGSTWLGPFTADGVNEIHGTHDGERNFIVTGHDADGGWELMINEIGEYEGSGTFRAGGGAFWIDVEADGNWTLEIE